MCYKLPEWESEANPDPDFLRIKRNISDPGAFAMIVLHTPSMVSAGIVAILAFSVSLVFGGPVFAQSGGAFQIDHIAVDVTAESAAKARERARSEAEQRAFRLLMERITLRVDWPRLPVPSRDDIAAYIRDFAMSEEKTSAVRYIADLGFRFKSEDIRTLLSEMRIPFAETISKPVLVLPVYQSAGSQLLWDDPNPWRTAWAKREVKPGLVPLILPIGDLTDIGLIGAEQAIGGDDARLRAIAARYKAGDTIVAQCARRIAPDTGATILEVSVTRFGSALREQTLVKSFEAGADESPEALLGRAAEEIVLDIEDNWKRDNLIQAGVDNVVAVTARIDGLKSWLEMRKRLESVAVIRTIDLRLISKTEARMNIYFTGVPEQLALAMEQADLGLLSAGSHWVLTSEATR